MQTQRHLPHQQPAPLPAAEYPPYEAQLHAVRRPPAKSWKKPPVPPPPTPRVYHIDPKGFRRLVQALTGKPKSPALAFTPELLHHELSAALDLERWDVAGQF